MSAVNKAIRTREDIVDALTEAAELEHQLLIQYLFAAFSLKRKIDEEITPLQQAQIRGWERTLLEVARQEMGHLGLVCNLLSAIGAAPRFGRPNLPLNPGDYYPLSIAFTLSQFSYDTIFRFVCFELPADASLELRKSIQELSPRFEKLDPPIYNRVGDLYEQIAIAIGRFEESETNPLFIGPKTAQDEDLWSERMNLRLVVDKASALEAITAIVVDGEGTVGNRQHSHFSRFQEILQELRTIDFEPARNVADNPFTLRHRDNPSSNADNLITKESTRRVAELFNSIYQTLLLMLMQYYSYGGETTSQRRFLRDTLGQIMSSLIRPIAEILTELPIADTSKRTAGPGFEITSDLRLSPFGTNRWIILQERVGHAQQLAGSVQDVHPRLRNVLQSLTWISANLGRLHINFY